MTNDASDAANREAQRVLDAYARRERLGLDSRYAYWLPANLFMYQARERIFLSLLRDANMVPLTGRRVLDLGCGDGAVLRDLVRYGASEVNLHGLDLIEDRVEGAKAALPSADIRLGDAQKLPWPDDNFDLVLGFTFLSSVVDQGARRRIAAEIARVTRPSGRVVFYDFRLNPTNRTVRPVHPEHIQQLFQGRDMVVRSTTLAPPLTRLLMRAPGGWLACSALEVLPFLRTHFLAAVTL